MNVPLTIGFFTSTKGHWKRRGDYLITLDHWNKQVPLSMFNLIAHVKASIGDEAIADEMRRELEQRGFKVIVTGGDWARGTSHQVNYLTDQITMSKDSAVCARPYFLMLEDDAPLKVNAAASLEAVLLRSCQLLETNPELVSVRTIRRGDYEGGVPQLGEAENGHAFYSPYTDYQTPILRSIDFVRLCMVLEGNPQACAQVQCEALWASILRYFSRNPLKHLVWKPDFVEAVHIGVEHPESELAKLI